MKLKNYGVRRQADELIEDYLFFRNEKVQVGKELSSPKVLPKGIPQGTIFGPILFEKDIDLLGLNSSSREMI